VVLAWRARRKAPDLMREVFILAPTDLIDHDELSASALAA
jgi:hypothetical protein